MDAELRKNEKLEIAEYTKKKLVELQSDILLVESLQSKHLRPKDWEELGKLFEDKLDLHLLVPNASHPILTFEYLRERKFPSINQDILELVVKAKK